MDDLDQIETFTLPSGIEVIAHQMPQSEIGSFTIAFNAGAYFDPEDKPGLAHFCEHMLMQGTPEIVGEAAVFDALLAMGPDIIGGTSQAQMLFGGTVLEQDFNNYVRLWAHLLSDASLLEGDVEIQKGVIAQEIREYASDPADAFDVKAKNIIFYGDHAFSNETLGTVESISGINQPDVETFVHRYLVTQNATIFYVGPRTGEELKNSFSEFDRLPTGQRQEFAPVAYPAGLNAYIPWKSDIQKTCLIIPLRDNELSLLERDYLRGFISNQISNALRAQGLAYSPFAHFTKLGNASALCVEFEVDPADLEKCWPVISKELNNLGAITPHDITNQMRNIKIQQLKSLGNPSVRLGMLSRQKSPLFSEKVSAPSCLIPGDINFPPMDCVTKLVAALYGQPVSLATMGPREDFPTAQDIEKTLWGRTVSKGKRFDAMPFANG